ncbi:hypothetical protein GKE82_13250 [Conexibacter sp. W3-3-2]|uniref:RCC1 domain-containing protein n=1 Tax=Conexibacter sp. W3-3-2 TaxID=2675227 RepID=UPI0012B884C3|nr:hypothetical protein [Conexibacter sp. W3-3-2]MTD45230.1 hypothetical protein [Conexibacter sp. W3-3-2]
MRRSPSSPRSPRSSSPSAPPAREIGGATTATTQAGAAKIASGTLGSCAITPQATVHCWGEGDQGQLATGSTANVGDVPGSTTVQVWLGRGVVPVQVSSGSSHSCALAQGGAVYCWGRNIVGQTGDGTAAENRGDDPGERPFRVALPDGLGAKQVATGANHSCAILTDTSVACWGGNANGVLGLGQPDDGASHLPARVDLGEAGAFSISSRDRHTCVVTLQRKLLCWGANSRSQIGDGAFSGPKAAIGDDPGEKPIQPPTVQASENYLAVVTLDQSTCAIEVPSDSVHCWGEGARGQLSQGNTNAATLNDVTVDLDGQRARAISAGSEAVCALTDGTDADTEPETVRCWGDNQSGMLGGGFIGNNWGDSLGETKPVTTDIGAGRTAIGIAVGDDHTCAMLTSGQALCWGEGSNGRLASGSTADTGTTKPAGVATVTFGTDLPDGDGDGLPDRFDGCPAAAAQTDDGCPPPTVPPAQPPVAQPPVAQPPTTVAKKVKVAVTLTAKSTKTKSCPKTVTAAIVGAKPAVSRALKAKKAKKKSAGGKVRCVVSSTFTWKTAPAAAKSTKVKVSGKGLTTRTITVKL